MKLLCVRIWRFPVDAKAARHMSQLGQRTWAAPSPLEIPGLWCSVSLTHPANSSCSLLGSFLSAASRSFWGTCPVPHSFTPGAEP